MKTLLNLSSNLFGDIFSHSQENSSISVNVAPSKTGNKKKHIIILHGWGKTKEDMKSWMGFIKSTSFSNDKTIWNVGYASKLKFTDVANFLMSFFEQKKSEGFNFEDVYFIGYSMGGIIARQMIADGFSVTKLVSICSPHLGLHWFIPGIINAGVSSLKQTSKELESLNSNAIEQKMRNRYMFCSIGYSIKNRFGTIKQDGDTIVAGKSARGEGLGVEIERFKTEIQYQSIKIEPGAPHLEGMRPENFKNVLPFLTKQENLQESSS